MWVHSLSDVEEGKTARTTVYGAGPTSWEEVDSGFRTETTVLGTIHFGG